MVSFKQFAIVLLAALFLSGCMGHTSNNPPGTQPAQSYPSLKASVATTGASDAPDVARHPTSDRTLAIGCGNKDPLLQQSPVRPDQISTVVPLGNFAPPGHVLPTQHMYYRYVHDASGIPALTTIYAPANLSVNRIIMFNNTSSENPFISYRVDFSICDGVSGYFIHVVTLSDKLAAAARPPYDTEQVSNVGSANPDHNYYKKFPTPIQVMAGEVLGTAGGSPGLPDALDFGLSDSRTEPGQVANPTRWEDSDRHYVCSLDYYPADIAGTLYAKIGDFNGHRVHVDEPACGTAYQDKPGTAQGAWVAKTSNTSGIWDIPSLLELGHSNFNHSRAVFSFGNELQRVGFDTDSIYEFTPKSGRVNADFSRIFPDGKIYCFETTKTGGSDEPGPSVLVQMLDNDNLRIGRLEGPCGQDPWQFSKYLDYGR